VEFFTFYVNIWVSALIILVLSVKISRYLKNFDCKPEIRKLRRKLKYYPLVIVVCWFFPFIDRIMIKAGKEQAFLVTLHVISISLQGSLNFLVYGLSFVRRNTKDTNEKRIEELPTSHLDMNRDEPLVWLIILSIWGWFFRSDIKLTKLFF